MDRDKDIERLLNDGPAPNYTGKVDMTLMVSVCCEQCKTILKANIATGRHVSGYPIVLAWVEPCKKCAAK